MIGAGVVGASIGRELARLGLQLTVLDRASGVGGGCSYANAALLAPSHVGPLATPALLREAAGHVLHRTPPVRMSLSPPLLPWIGRLLASAAPSRSVPATERLRWLAVESTQLHCRLSDEGLNPTLRKTGALDVYLGGRKVPDARLLSLEEVRRLEPSVSGVDGGTYDSEEWTVESRSFVEAMLDDAIARGADVRFSTPVSGLLKRGTRVVGVQTPARTLTADHVVIAAGLDSRRLAAQVGLRLPLRGGRGYVVDLAPRPDVGPSIPVRIKERRVVVTPLADRVRVCGFIEFGDEHRPVSDQRWNALVDVAERVLPSLRDRPAIDRWAGERPCAADGVPIVGRSHFLNNLSVATGHGMWGLILAPVTARLIGRAVLERHAEPTDASWLSPDRFTAAGPWLDRRTS